MAGNVWEWTSSHWGTDWEKPSYGYPYQPDDGRERLEAGNDVLAGVAGRVLAQLPGPRPLLLPLLGQPERQVLQLRVSCCGLPHLLAPLLSDTLHSGTLDVKMDRMYQEICSWENLRIAHRKASRGKRGRAAAAAFEYNLADKLVALQEELVSRT